MFTDTISSDARLSDDQTAPIRPAPISDAALMRHLLAVAQMARAEDEALDNHFTQIAGDLLDAR